MAEFHDVENGDVLDVLGIDRKHGDPTPPGPTMEDVAGHMGWTRIEAGTEDQWRPLLTLIGHADAIAFMFMGTRPGPRTAAGVDVTVYLYKHARTRRYLNVGDDGRCYHWTGEERDSYEHVPTARAIEHVHN